MPLSLEQPSLLEEEHVAYQRTAYALHVLR